MDTQNLSAFIEVATSQSFSIAAEKLFLTHSSNADAVCRAELSESLGDVLTQLEKNAAPRIEGPDSLKGTERKNAM